jgi:hypothetical protein
MVRLFLAAASLVRIEQQLTQGDENDDADERGATPQRTTRGVGLPAGEPVTRNGPLQPPSDPPRRMLGIGPKQTESLWQRSAVNRLNRMSAN